MEMTKEKEIIKNMSYTDFVSFLKEENRPSGGKKTIREIALQSFVHKDSKVLEVGCTNGFSSLEIARLVGCSVWGVDINPRSVENAKKRCVGEENIHFSTCDACSLPFEDNFFDLVICGNALSFMRDKGTALNEVMRVVKDWKFISLVPIWYRKSPDDQVVEKVSSIIGNKIQMYTKQMWLDFFEVFGLELYYMNDYCFKDNDEETIERYMQTFFQRDSLARLDEPVFQAAYAKWKDIIGAFNDNLSHCAYSVVLLRKRPELEEIEAFPTIKLG